MELLKLDLEKLQREKVGGSCAAASLPTPLGGACTAAAVPPPQATRLPPPCPPVTTLPIPPPPPRPTLQAARDARLEQLLDQLKAVCTELGEDAKQQAAGVHPSLVNMW
jgi:hypothetical protein